MKQPGKASFCFPLLVAMLVALLCGTGCAAVLAPNNAGVALSFDSAPAAAPKKGRSRAPKVLPDGDMPSESPALEPKPIKPPAHSADDSCKRFWEQFGPTDHLPPIIRDCLDITLYQGHDLRLILSLPWLKLVFP